MIIIRPVSDLRNKYPEIEDLVLKEDEADREAEDPNTKYYTHEEFKQIARGILDGKE